MLSVNDMSHAAGEIRRDQDDRACAAERFAKYEPKQTDAALAAEAAARIAADDRAWPWMCKAEAETQNMHACLDRVDCLRSSLTRHHGLDETTEDTDLREFYEAELAVWTARAGEHKAKRDDYKQRARDARKQTNN